MTPEERAEKIVPLDAETLYVPKEGIELFRKEIAAEIREAVEEGVEDQRQYGMAITRLQVAREREAASRCTVCANNTPCSSHQIFIDKAGKEG